MAEKRPCDNEIDDSLLEDEDSSSLKRDETSTCMSNDSLTAVFEKFNENMSSMAQNMSFMNRTMLSMASSSKKRKVSHSDSEHSFEPEETTISELDDSEKLLEGIHKDEKNGEENLLDNIANELNAGEQTAPDVSDKLAQIINKRWEEKLPAGKLSEKLQKHSRPGNLANLVVPRVNPEIWVNMNHAVKQADLRKSYTQNIISKVGAILAKSTDSLLKAHADKNSELKIEELIGLHTDAIALLGHTQVELSLSRREAIKPSLKKEFAGLCSPQIPVTSFLFGDQLQQQLSNIQASNKISQTAASGSKLNTRNFPDNWRNNHQYQKQPYQQQNRWRGRGGKSKNFKFPLYKRKEGEKN